MTVEVAEVRRVRIAVCTFRRPERLCRLLHSIEVAAAAVDGRVLVGVHVIDDDPGRSAEPVLQRSWRFSLGAHYLHSGQRNISAARNLALAAARTDSDLIMMTDDDVVVPALWIASHLDVLDATGCDAVTGSKRYDYGTDAPAWLRSERFINAELVAFTSGAVVDTCLTANTLMQTRALDKLRGLRFDDDLGRAGGEDEAFFREAIRRGLDARGSAEATVVEDWSGARSTFRYLLRRALWLGNTEAVTNLYRGSATRLRLCLRATRRAGRSLASLARGAISRDTVELRWHLWVLTQSFGMFLGVVGVRLEHR